MNFNVVAGNNNAEKTFDSELSGYVRWRLVQIEENNKNGERGSSKVCTMIMVARTCLVHLLHLLSI